MITSLLLFSTFDFATFVFSAFVFFSAGLLFLDAWRLDEKKVTLLIRAVGFFLLAISSLITSASVSQPIVVWLIHVLKVTGLGVIFYSIVKEPVLKKPKVNGFAFALPSIFSKRIIPQISINVSLLISLVISVLISVSAALSATICFLYLKRTFKGFDKQLFLAGVSFIFFAIADFMKIAFIWSNTTNVFWSKFLAPHAVYWNIHMSVYLFGLIILAYWIWGYIRFRIQLQLFSIVLFSTLIIFLVTTFIFSFLLLKNLENDALSHLKTDVKVIQYALDRLQLESLSHARAIAADSSLKTALVSANRSDLYKIISENMVSQNLASVIITSQSGEVVVRGENSDSWGDSLSDDALIKSALSGKELSTRTQHTKPLASDIFIQSAVPIYTGKTATVSGTVMTGFVIDNAFVDGIKVVTGLDATVFAGDKRAATTIISPDGKTRFMGTLEANKAVTDTVLKQGQMYIGSSTVLNVPYYTAYAPLNTLGDQTIGMLFVGKPQRELLEAAERSLRLTFLGSAILVAIATIPAYFISRYIQENVEA